MRLVAPGPAGVCCCYICTLVDVVSGICTHGDVRSGAGGLDEACDCIDTLGVNVGVGGSYVGWMGEESGVETCEQEWIL